MPNPAANPSHLRQTAGPVAVAVGGPEMFQAAQQTIATGHRFFEFRLDSLPTPEEALPRLAAFLHQHPGTTAIATCSRTENGGHHTGWKKLPLRLVPA